MVSHIVELHPRNYSEAMKSSKVLKWKKAMEEEISALRRLGVFEVIKRFRDSNVLHSKWGFKTKTDAEGQVECFEDRIVFCGNEQKIGVDYFFVAAAIMDMSTVKIVLALDLFWVF